MSLLSLPAELLVRIFKGLPQSDPQLCNTLLISRTTLGPAIEGFYTSVHVKGVGRAIGFGNVLQQKGELAKYVEDVTLDFWQNASQCFPDLGKLKDGMLASGLHLTVPVLPNCLSLNFIMDYDVYIRRFQGHESRRETTPGLSDLFLWIRQCPNLCRLSIGNFSDEVMPDPPVEIHAPVVPSSLSRLRIRGWEVTNPDTYMRLISACAEWLTDLTIEVLRAPDPAFQLYVDLEFVSQTLGQKLQRFTLLDVGGQLGTGERYLGPWQWAPELFNVEHLHLDMPDNIRLVLSGFHSLRVLSVGLDSSTEWRAALREVTQSIKRHPPPSLTRLEFVGHGTDHLNTCMNDLRIKMSDWVDHMECLNPSDPNWGQEEEMEEAYGRIPDWRLTCFFESNPICKHLDALTSSS